MLPRSVLAWSLSCLLLLALFSAVESRRGAGGRWGSGGTGRTAGGLGGAGPNRGVNHNHNHNHNHNYRVPHGHHTSSSSGSSAGKIAGAAAAGALGGMVLGHGLSSLARPGYGHGGYGGHGAYGHGYGGGHGHPRHAGEHGHAHPHHEDGVFSNETDMEYYVDATARAHSSGFLVLFGAALPSFVFGYWVS